MALFDDQQQQEQQNQLQKYGVRIGPGRIRSVQQAPYVPLSGNNNIMFVGR